MRFGICASLALLGMSGFYFSPDEGSGGGGAPPAPTPPAPRVYTEAEFNALSTRLSSLETEHSDAKTKLTAFETSQLSEQQKQEQRATEAETKRADAEKAADSRAAELKQERLERQIERVAGELKLVDADAALRLLDQTKIEFDDAGKPKNVKELLTQLATDKPYLVAAVTPAGVGLTPGAARTGTGGTPTAEDKINADFTKSRGSQSSFRIG